MKKRTVRITLDLGPVSYKRLNSLQDKLEDTKVGLVKKSLELLDLVAAEQDKGNKLILEAPDGSQKEIKVVGLHSSTEGNLRGHEDADELDDPEENTKTSNHDELENGKARSFSAEEEFPMTASL